MTIESEVPEVIITSKAIEANYLDNNVAISEGTKDLEVTVNRKEYSIVGDELYIPKRYEDAPQWLRDIIDTVTNTALSNALSDVSTLGDMLDGLIAELNIAKNTYTQSIISDNDINERINTAITTLNSSLSDADSTILEVALTRATPEQVQTIATNILTASINGGSIGASIENLQSAITDIDNARATDYNLLNAAIGEGLEDESSARASALEVINAYVGIDEAGASTGTGLSAYLEDSDGVIGGADSQLNNTIRVTAEGIESKWAYNSIVNIGGIYKKSGFGLTTNYTSGDGTEENPYISEFWIDASRLKFTNSNVTGQVAPFTIDASGTAPKIAFNGLVSFKNVSETEDGVTLVPSPGGGSYSTVGNVTGALVVTLPNSWTNTMMTLEVEVYNYAMNKSFMLKLAGYNHTSGWINTSSNLIGSGLLDFNVRFGHDGTKCCIVIGETTSIWSYPKVKIKNCTFGYANYAVDTWNSGWNVGLSADLTGYVFTKTHISSWQQEVQRAIDNDATYIDGSKIVTGTLAADSAFVNSLNVVGGVVADTIVANSSIESPIINSATFNGTYLSVEDIKVKAYGYPNNFGDIAINRKYVTFTQAAQNILVSAYSEVFINRSKLSGYSKERMCSATQIFKLTCSFIGASPSAPKYLYLYVSTNGGSTYSLLNSIEDVPNISELALAYTYSYSGTGDIRFKVSGKWTYPSSVSANVLAQLEVFTINT